MSSYWRRPAYITRNILLVSWVSLLNDISSELLYPVMPLFLAGIGLTASQMGLLEGIAEALSAYGKYYFGKQSDGIKNRSVYIRWGYGISTLARSIYAFLPLPIPVTLGRISDRFGKAIRTAPRDALLLEESPPHHQNAVFGFHRSMDSWGAFVGPVIALLFLTFFSNDIQYLFYIALVPGVLAWFLTFSLPKNENLPPKEKNSAIRTTPKELKFFISWGIFLLLNSSDFFILYYLTHLGYSQKELILLYIFYNAIYALSSHWAGRWADKKGSLSSLFISLALYIPSYFLFLNGNQWPFALLGFVLYGLSMAFNEGQAKIFYSNIGGTKKRGTQMGRFALFTSICLLLSNLIAGQVWQSFSPEWAIILPCFGAMLSIFLLYFYSRNDLL